MHSCFFFKPPTGSHFSSVKNIFSSAPSQKNHLCYVLSIIIFTSTHYNFHVYSQQTLAITNNSHKQKKEFCTCVFHLVLNITEKADMLFFTQAYKLLGFFCKDCMKRKTSKRQKQKAAHNICGPKSRTVSCRKA